MAKFKFVNNVSLNGKIYKRNAVVDVSEFEGDEGIENKFNALVDSGGVVEVNAIKDEKKSVFKKKESKKKESKKKESKKKEQVKLPDNLK